MRSHKGQAPQPPVDPHLTASVDSDPDNSDGEGNAGARGNDDERDYSQLNEELGKHLIEARLEPIPKPTPL